jgi:uncharacterized protein (DUF697 family)
MPSFATSTAKLLVGAVRDLKPVQDGGRPIVLCGRSRPVDMVRDALLDAPGSDEAAAPRVVMRRLQAGDEARLQAAAVVVYGGEVDASLDADTRADLEVLGRVGAPKVIVLEALDLPSDAVSQAALVEGISTGDIMPYKRGWFPVRRVLGQVAHRAGDPAPALAHRLPAFRPYVTHDLIESAARRNAAVALATWIPGANFPAMASVQLRLVLRIAACYGHEVSPDRGVELLGTLGAGLGMRAVARELLDFLPGVGWAVQSLVGYTGTRALGQAAVEYFERGAPADVGRLRRLAEEAQAAG